MAKGKSRGKPASKKVGGKLASKPRPNYQYDPKKRELAKVYSRAKLINGLLNGILVPVLLFSALLVFGWSAWMAGLSFSASPALQVPIYAILFVLLLEAVQFPIGFYSGYIHDKKYKISNQSIGGWLVDFSKGLLLELLFSVILVTGLYWLIGATSLWWLYGGIAWFFITIFFSNIWPVLIFPFFYKTGPYKDRKQREKLLGILKRAGAKNVKTVLVAKESEKSNKANAFFAGMGKTKRIVLFDTLINGFTPAEVETVIG